MVRDFAPAGVFRSLAYRALWSFAHVFERAAHAAIYAAAGLLRQDDFTAASRVLWCNYGMLVQDVDCGLEVWERRMYGAVLEPGDRILLVACGAGRDLLALCELGYDLTGLDPTPELVRLARRHIARRGFRATVQEGFVETTELDGRFDVIVLSGNCYSFVSTAAARVSTLERIKSHLTARARVVITYSGAVRPPPRSINITRAVSRLTGADWRPESGDAFSRDFLTHRLLRYEHMFLPGEVARECERAGLRVVEDVRTAGCYVVAVPAN